MYDGTALTLAFDGVLSGDTYVLDEVAEPSSLVMLASGLAGAAKLLCKVRKCN
jgi:hypothetical protein